MAHDVATGERTAADYSCGIGDDDVGSFLFPAKEQQGLLNKIDDVRYDVRKTGGIVGAGLAALAGAVALLGIGHLWSAARALKK